MCLGLFAASAIACTIQSAGHEHENFNGQGDTNEARFNDHLNREKEDNVYGRLCQGIIKSGPKDSLLCTCACMCMCILQYDVSMSMWRGKAAWGMPQREDATALHSIFRW